MLDSILMDCNLLEYIILIGTYNTNLLSTGCKLTQGIYQTDADGIKIIEGVCVALHSGGSSTGVKVSYNPFLLQFKIINVKSMNL